VRVIGRLSTPHERRSRSRDKYASVISLVILLTVLTHDGVDGQLARDRLPNLDRWLVGMVKMDLQPHAFLTTEPRAEQNPATDRAIRNPEPVVLKLARHPTEYARWVISRKPTHTQIVSERISARFGRRFEATRDRHWDRS